MWANNGNKDKWRLDSFTQITKIVPLILFGSILLLAINGVVVVYLHIKEKKEDDKTRVTIDFWINFISF